MNGWPQTSHLAGHMLSPLSCASGLLRYAPLEGVDSQGSGGIPVRVTVAAFPVFLVAGQLPPVCPDPVEELEHGLVTVGEVRTYALPRLVLHLEPRMQDGIGVPCQAILAQQATRSSERSCSAVQLCSG